MKKTFIFLIFLILLVGSVLAEEEVMPFEPQPFKSFFSSQSTYDFSQSGFECSDKVTSTRMFQASASTINIGNACGENSIVRLFECSNQDCCATYCYTPVYQSQKEKLDGVNPAYTNLVVGRSYLYFCNDCSESGISPSEPTETCTDSDGTDYKKYSYVTYKTAYTEGTYYDSCDALNSGVVREKICKSDGYPDTKEYNCKNYGSDWTCKDGKCVIGEPETDSCGLAGGYRQTSKCGIFQEELTSYKTTDFYCCKDIKKFCVKDNQRLSIGQSYCLNDNSFVCVQAVNDPEYESYIAQKDCSFFGGCDSSTGKCKSTNVVSDQCEYNGGTYKVGDYIGEFYCNGNIKERKSVYDIQNGKCVVEVTEKIQCSGGCSSGVCGGGGTTTKKNSGLTAQEIQESTSDNLFLHSCKISTDCENSRCVSYSSLVQKGVLTDMDVDSILNEITSSTYWGNVLKGAGAGASICAITGIGIPACAGAGAGIGWISTAIYDAFTGKKPTEVGVCFKEEEKPTNPPIVNLGKYDPCSWGVGLAGEKYGCIAGWSIVGLIIFIIIILFK